LIYTYDDYLSKQRLSVQNYFFPLYNATLFQVHGKSQAQDSQLGILVYKANHNVLLNTESQVDFDRLLQIHMLYKTEKYNDMS
jgi:hypothetical protein